MRVFRLWEEAGVASEPLLKQLALNCDFISGKWMMLQEGNACKLDKW